MQAPGDGLTWRARAWRPAVAIAGAALASLAAGDVMVLTRLALGVRTLPERLMDLMLLVIPPSLFEATLLSFGFDAKRYALALTVAAMMIGLTLAGGWVVARGWSIARLALLSLAIWLLEMLVLMPLSGAGLFAIALIDGTKAAIGAHLAVALTYVAG